MDNLDEAVYRLLADAVDDPRVISCPDLDLYGEGLLDSFAWVQLLEGLEDAFGIELWPTQVSRAQTATPRAVVELVRSRLSSPNT